jgi:ComF family protein
MWLSRRQVGGIARQAGALVFPERCVSCGRFGALLCLACAARMEPATGPGRCPNCSARWTKPLNCHLCAAWDSRLLDGGRAAFEMAGPARHLVHALKYGGVRAAARPMAARMLPLWQPGQFDAAIPVPLHRARRRARGFNQAEVLLRELGWPLAPGRLVRVRKTKTQVGLHARERRANVQGAFTYHGPPLDGLSLALVDDVITTGATANECASLLRDHGARRVVVVAFARATHEREGVPGD